MNRVIPGTITVEGREFLYVEAKNEETFVEFMNNAASFTPPLPPSTKGAVLDGLILIVTPNKKRFLGLSYKGTVKIWRNMLTDYCKESGVQWASIDEDKLITSDESTFPLEDCVVNFL